MNHLESGEIEDRSPQAKSSTLRRVGVFAVNVLLVLVILGLIIATWMPAIYTRNEWFRRTFLK